MKPRRRLQHYVNMRNALRGVVLAEVLVMFAYAWVIYPWQQGHTGDFLGGLSHRDDWAGFWDGRGIGNGPIFALYDLILRPVHDLPAMRGMFLWNHVLLGITLILLLRHACRVAQRTLDFDLGLLLVFLWVNFYPLEQTIRQNNVETTVLFFLALHVVLGSEKPTFLSGFALGLSLSAKPQAVLLLPYAIWRRRWIEVLGASAGLLLCFGGIAWLKSIAPNALFDDWIHGTLQVWPSEYNENQALSGLWSRLFATTDFSTLRSATSPTVLDPASAGIGILISRLAIVAFLTHGLIARARTFFPAEPISGSERTNEIMMLLCATLLVAPHNHLHYFALISPAFLVLAAEGSVKIEGPRKLALIAYLLTGPLVFLRLFDTIVFAHFPVSAIELWKNASLPAIGLLLLFGSLWRRQRGTAGVHVPQTEGDRLSRGETARS